MFWDSDVNYCLLCNNLAIGLDELILLSLNISDESMFPLMEILCCVSPNRWCVCVVVRFRVNEVPTWIWLSYISRVRSDWKHSEKETESRRKNSHFASVRYFTCQTEFCTFWDKQLSTVCNVYLEEHFSYVLQ